MGGNRWSICTSGDECFVFVVVPVVLKALLYDERKGAISVGMFQFFVSSPLKVL